MGGYSSLEVNIDIIDQDKLSKICKKAKLRNGTSWDGTIEKVYEKNEGWVYYSQEDRKSGIRPYRDDYFFDILSSKKNNESLIILVEIKFHYTSPKKDKDLRYQNLLDFCKDLSWCAKGTIFYVQDICRAYSNTPIDRDGFFVLDGKGNCHFEYAHHKEVDAVLLDYKKSHPNKNFVSFFKSTKKPLGLIFKSTIRLNKEDEKYYIYDKDESYCILSIIEDLHLDKSSWIEKEDYNYLIDNIPKDFVRLCGEEIVTYLISNNRRVFIGKKINPLSQKSKYFFVELRFKRLPNYE